jgi:predicted DNA binding protein
VSVIAGVSRKQRNVLLTAYDMEYYDGPRRATGEDVARELEITW